MTAQQAPPTAETPLVPGEAKVAPAGTVPVGGTPPAPAETEPAAPKPVEAAPKPAGPVPPAPGQTFLQVAAVKKPEAEVLVDVLRKRGFPAIVAPVVPGQPDDALWRALVGPFQDAASLAKARADLQATVGVRDIIVRKY
jgi:cell division septation protein DedD